MSATDNGNAAFITGTHCSSPSSLKTHEMLDVHQPVANLDGVGSTRREQVDLVALQHHVRRRRSEAGPDVPQLFAETTPFPVGDDCGHGSHLHRRARQVLIISPAAARGQALRGADLLGSPPAPTGPTRGPRRGPRRATASLPADARRRTGESTWICLVGAVAPGLAAGLAAGADGHDRAGHLVLVSGVVDDDVGASDKEGSARTHADAHLAAHEAASMRAVQRCSSSRPARPWRCRQLAAPKSTSARREGCSRTRVPQMSSATTCSWTASASTCSW